MFPTFLGRGSCLRSLFVAVLGVTLSAPALFAQRSRLDGPIRGRQRVTLNGHSRPQLQNAQDEGLADPSMVLSGVTLVFRPSAAQQADLDQLLRDQQDPTSPEYHHWLTPEQYATRFGVSSEDLEKITQWLRDQSLEVTDVARSHNSIQVRGTARTVGAAFGIQIRNYRVNGRTHFANATEPSIPAELDAIVTAIDGLDDFHLEPRGVVRRDVAPNFTSASGRHYLAPDDLATIYNIKPLHAAGLDGSGQTIVVAGQSAVDTADVQTFRTRFGLPSKLPETMLVPNSRDPGVVTDDAGEANLDMQWAGAVARNARILYVYAPGVMTAVRYAIDQNLAPVISVSYGLCERQSSAASLRAFQSWATQAAAQGITWINASGDSGATDCWTGNSGYSNLAVDAPASVPEVTGIGGTTLNDADGTYWSATNGANDSSVLSYIPEVVWNDSTSTSPASGGGGPSAFYLKPSWQTGAGVPSDGARSVPDISLAASANHDGYIVYTAGKAVVYGGTSAGTPVFAGVVALLNQYLSQKGASGGVGNVNPRLYSLAQTTPEVFHDITTGNNKTTITCPVAARNCTEGTYGYDAAAGYDQATGLGSIDAYNLVTKWNGPAGSVSKGATSLTLTSSAGSIAAGDSVTLTAIVQAQNGGVPLGTVNFRAGSTTIGTASLRSDANRSVATQTVTGAFLAVGSNTITAEYSGDATFAGSTASVSVTVNPPANNAPPSISGFANAASFRAEYAPGMLLTIFGSQLAPAPFSATTVPLPAQIGGVSVTVNGVLAPLLYVSPTQINVQVPYETPINVAATVVVNNNGSSTTGSLTPTQVAPGIFVDSSGAPVPGASGSRGQIVTLYVTGVGAITPTVATGSAPAANTNTADLPRAQQSVSVSVGGRPASISFAGIPPGLVGVMQVNYQIPADAVVGRNAVSVQVGSVSSSPVSLTVN